MNRAAPALIFIAPVKLRIIQLTHQYLQLHHPALLVRNQILGQTLRADEEVARRAAQEALLTRRLFNFPSACRLREPEPKLCIAFQQARLSTHRHHLTRTHLIMPSAPPQLPSFKNRQPLDKERVLRRVSLYTCVASMPHSGCCITVVLRRPYAARRSHARETVRNPHKEIDYGGRPRSACQPTRSHRADTSGSRGDSRVALPLPRVCQRIERQRH